MVTMTSCADKGCIFYSCTALSMSDFHALLPYSQYSNLTYATPFNHAQLTVTAKLQNMTSQK